MRRIEECVLRTVQETNGGVVQVEECSVHYGLALVSGCARGGRDVVSSSSYSYHIFNRHNFRSLDNGNIRKREQKDAWQSLDVLIEVKLVILCRF